MENAAHERLQRREQHTTVEKVKERMQLHLQETKEQQNRLMHLIKDMNGMPTLEKEELPISTPPESIRSAIHKSMTYAEQELVQIVEDMIVDMIATVMRLGDASPSLRQSLEEEEKMFAWLRTNSPAIFAKLWPEIESAY